MKQEVKALKDMYFDGHLVTVMDKWKDRIMKDWDFLICVDGREGAGKSMLAQQVGLYLDPNLKISSIVFTADQFMEKIKYAEKYECIVFDEAFGALSSGAAIKGFNRTLMKALREIRRKNLFLIVVMPSFFDFTKYIALHRSVALFHVYVDEDYKRGRFLAYNFQKKNTLYIKGREYYNYNVVKANFYGTFCKGWAVDHEIYDKKKDNATAKEEENDETTKGVWLQRDKAINTLKKELDWTQVKIAETVGLSDRRVCEILKKFK